MAYPETAAAALPSSYDLRDVGAGHNNYITDVRDQRPCNSCTAYAVVAAIEGATNIKLNTPGNQRHLSENQLFFCGGSNGCDTLAWYPKGALEYCRDTGITDASLFGNGQQCLPTNPSWPITKISSFQQLPDATAIKQCLTGIGPYAQSPVAAVLVLYQSLNDWTVRPGHDIYKFDDKKFDTRLGGHVVCIVGYDDHKGHWICKNSWGKAWGGLGGFFNIAYGDCHIDDFLMYGVVV
jgi:C1A family cysteine protease